MRPAGRAFYSNLLLPPSGARSGSYIWQQKEAYVPDMSACALFDPKAFGRKSSLKEKKKKRITGKVNTSYTHAVSLILY